MIRRFNGLKVILFPQVYRQAREIISSGKPFLVTGMMEMDSGRGEVFLKAEKVTIAPTFLTRPRVAGKQKPVFQSIGTLDGFIFQNSPFHGSQTFRDSEKTFGESQREQRKPMK